VALNKDVARGNELFVTLRLESGEELPFIVDTGSPFTIFDKSMEPKLGKRLGQSTLWNFGSKSEGGFYAAPMLYLGDTPLQKTSKYILTSDFKAMSAKAGRPILGVLGMDCLEHYCVQLDFEAGKMRFLNPDHLDTATIGKAFTLTFSSEGQSMKQFIRPFIHRGSLIAAAGNNLMVDTGYRVDGALESGLFQRKIKEQRSREGEAIHGDNHRVWFSQCNWSGGHYTNLLVGDGGNIIGLEFLARHLVTLNFPKRMMYLKQTSVGPLADEKMRAAEAFFNNLKETGRLPGWSKSDQGTIYLEPFPDFEELDGRKIGDSSDYHYQVGRLSKDGSWTLQKAWRTDENDNTVEEYAVP